LWPSKSKDDGRINAKPKKGNKGEEEIWWELSKKKAQKQQVSQREEERGNE